jgi:hypothetical protein
MFSSPREYAAARDALLERIVDALRADSRVVAAWLAGSIGRGEGDEWADYDLCTAINDRELPSFLADRSKLYASVGQVSLVQDAIPGQPGVGERFHLVNFAGAIEVDWSFVSLSKAVKPIGHLVLFEKQTIPVMVAPALPPEERRAEARAWAMFFWSMAPIAVKYTARGETGRAARQIDLLSRALICLWRLLDQPDGPAPWNPEANRPLENELDHRLPRPGRTLTPRSLVNLTAQLCAEAKLLQPHSPLWAPTFPTR